VRFAPLAAMRAASAASRDAPESAERQPLSEEEEALARSDRRQAAFDRFRSQGRDSAWASQTEPVLEEVAESVFREQDMGITIEALECRLWECVADVSYENLGDMRRMEGASFVLARALRKRGLGEVHPAAHGYGTETDVPRQRLYIRFPDRRERFAREE